MRPQLLKVSKEIRHSFSVRQDLVPYINNRWHYHQEVELIHFSTMNGTSLKNDDYEHKKHETTKTKIKYRTKKEEAELAAHGFLGNWVIGFFWVFGY